MFTLNEIITFEHESEHVLEHDLSNKNLFSNPKIYNANGNLTKRWYVYFSFRNPSSGKMERMGNIYEKTNKYKTKEDRLAILSSYRRNLLHLLKEGYDPFKDNTALFLKPKEKANNSIVAPTQTKRIRDNKKDITETVNKQPKMTLREGFDFGLKLKEKAVIDEVSVSGITNAALGTLMIELLKWLTLTNENKPATKADFKRLEGKLERYHRVNNIDPRMDGTLPYFDMETKTIVYRKNLFNFNL